MEVVLQNIGLIEALTLWFSGRKLDGMSLYGVPTLWISRFAKIATFVGGLTVVLDLLGAERIIRFGHKMQDVSRGWRLAITLLVAVALFYVIMTPAFVADSRTTDQIVKNQVAVINFFVLLVFFAARKLLWRLTSWMIVDVGRVLEWRRTQLYVRVFAVSLISVSFFLDLLTS